MKILKELMLVHSVSGREQAVSEKIEEMIAPYVDEVRRDAMGNLICYKKGTCKNPKKLMLAGHMDEIGFLVTGIDEKGGLLRSDGQKELQALYDQLPPAAKSYAGSVGGLAELAEMPDLTYRRAEFLKQAQADITTAPREAARLRASEPTRKEITK